MRTPLVLLSLSLLSVVAASFWPTPNNGPFLIAFFSTAASLILVARAWLGGCKRASTWAIVDGSNVMHWKDGKPDLATLKEVLSALTEAGLKPGVVFDANAGYKIIGHYMNDRAFARVLKLPVNRVMIAPKGTPADPLILRAARENKARIVTNDQFRDWLEDYPELRDPSTAIRGGFKQGKLWLSLNNS